MSNKTLQDIKLSPEEGLDLNLSPRIDSATPSGPIFRGVIAMGREEFSELREKAKYKSQADNVQVLSDTTEVDLKKDQVSLLQCPTVLQLNMGDPKDRDMYQAILIDSVNAKCAIIEDSTNFWNGSYIKLVVYIDQIYKV